MSILTYKCWIGKEDNLKKEISLLFSLLEDVKNLKINLLLSPEKQDKFSWICDLHLITEESKIGGQIGIQTSGTTGIPKIIWKNINQILNDKKGKGNAEDFWLLTYSPGRWAGLSVLLHAMKNNCGIIVPKDLKINSIIDKIENDKKITHISLTPSLFCKMLLSNSEKVHSSNVKQITFGGEYVIQKVLNDTKKIWPNARITHMYASTELGDICAVSDGLEGIPINKLKDFQLKDQELFINGKSTDDLWELRNNRLYFIGRKSDIINVGGAKVSCVYIENVINSLDGIYQSRAYPIKNALLGQVIGLDYVGKLSENDLKQQLKKLLPKYAIPLQLNKVNLIELSTAGKINRK